MMMIAAAIGAFAATPPTTADQPHPVIELRQYKIVPGARDRFIELFERELVETQEAEGIQLVGQFRDEADPERFTWIRAFSDMATRQRALTSFYSGPVWQANRGAANPMLLDNDNVLLLQPAWAGSGFAPAQQPRGSTAPARMVVVTIHYLWKQPDEAFTGFFKEQLAPALARAGLRVDAAFIRESAANNFPRLPVREGEKLFVWATRADSQEAWVVALSRLRSDPAWPAIAKQLSDLEERPAQRLLLRPTTRSRLR